MAATPLVRPDTSTGVVRVKMVSSPSCLSLFLPQHLRPPAAVSAQVWTSPAPMIDLLLLAAQVDDRNRVVRMPMIWTVGVFMVALLSECVSAWFGRQQPGGRDLSLMEYHRRRRIF